MVDNTNEKAGRASSPVQNSISPGLLTTPLYDVASSELLLCDIFLEVLLGTALPRQSATPDWLVWSSFSYSGDVYMIAHFATNKQKRDV